MLDTREDIRFVNFDSIVVILILLFGVLIYNNTDRNEDDHNRRPVSNFISVSENSAISGTLIRLEVFQKTWISNKDNFDLLAFNRNPLSDNKKAALRVSDFVSIRQNSNEIPRFLLRYHLFPAENDEPPFLS